MRWIRENRSEPPEHLRHSPELRDRMGQTMAAIWIDVKHEEPPEWMRHDILLRCAYGETLTMRWIIDVGTEPPAWMRHSAEVRDNLGWTMALHWVINKGTNPPEWMRHDPALQFYPDGITLAMEWIIHQWVYFSKWTEPPEWMRHYPALRDNKGYTLAMHWQYRFGGKHPEWMGPQLTREEVNKVEKDRADREEAARGWNRISMNISNYAATYAS